MTSAVVNAAMTASVGGVMEVEEDCCNTKAEYQNVGYEVSHCSSFTFRQKWWLIYRWCFWITKDNSYLNPCLASGETGIFRIMRS